MAGSDGQAVPKFGSFQPKKRPSSSVVTGSQQDSKRDDAKVEPSKHRIDKSEIRSRNQKHEGCVVRNARSHQKHEHRDRSPGRSTDRRPRERVTSQDSKSRSDRTDRKITERPSPVFQHSDLYIVDKKGDPANLQYRHSNKWTVPLYRLYGSGSIVGLHPDIKIDRKFSDDRSYTLVYPAKRQSRIIVDVDDLSEPRNTVRAKTDKSVAQKDETDRGDDEDFISMPKEHNESMCYDHPCTSIIQSMSDYSSRKSLGLAHCHT